MAKKKKEKAHANRAHSVLGASSAYRWMSCPGSVKLIETVPKPPPSAYAAEGTLAHELAEWALMAELHGHKPSFDKKFKSWLKGKTFPDDMNSAVQIYVDEVLRILNETKGELSVEERFDLEWLYPGMFGTNDACIREEFGCLYVIDYKHGAGIAVEAEKNAQLLYYALGAAKTGEYEECEMIVVQPRADHKEGPIRRWRVSIDVVWEFGKELKKAAIATTKKDAKLKSGEHCRFCAAAGVCPELHRISKETALTDFEEPKLPSVEALTPIQIQKILENKSLIKNFLDKVEEHATNKLLQGEKVEGLKLVQGRGKREWEDEQEFVETFGEDAYERKVLTVAKAEKVIGKEAIDGMWSSTPGRPIATHKGDRRKEYTPALEDFRDD